MNVFTEVYEKSIELLKTPSLHADWKDIEFGLKRLLQAGGPSVDQSKALDDLRKMLSEAAKKSGLVTAEAKEIARASQTDKNGFQDRAALIKQLKHFYLVERKGSQSVWVADQPKSYDQWNYDLFSGKRAEEVVTTLSKGNEVFGAGNRKMLSDALQLARKWSADTEIKLGGKSEATLASIQRWFHTEDVTADDIEVTRATLLGGSGGSPPPVIPAKLSFPIDHIYVLAGTTTIPLPQSMPVTRCR